MLLKSSEEQLQKKLEGRRSAGTYRALKPENGLIDFCSNDYLGFSRSPVLKQKIDEEISRLPFVANGSTGSRLISGNSTYTEDLERDIAAFHNADAGLLFNSGYDANLGLFSSVPQRGDTIIADELIHASIIDGSRLSFANKYTFRHNDLQSLEDKLKQAKGNCYIAIESVYSMDGDTPPIAEILELTEKYNANLIIDEAHAIGLYKKGIVCELGLEERVFARVVTFGKGLGCHGAIVLGSNSLREYLVNFARSFIYTTAAPVHQSASIKMAYELLEDSNELIADLRHKITLFKQSIISSKEYLLIDSDSQIQCILLKSNEKAKKIALLLQNTGFDVRPILSPTVPQGTERIRICLHAFNSDNEINALTDTINKLINA
jgi:8-amino-7-oxononanoate synthase